MLSTAGFTVSEILCAAEPPLPLQERVYVPETFGANVCAPLVVLIPDHALLPVHEVAFVEDHVSVVFCPAASVVGMAVKITVGTGVGATTLCVVAETILEYAERLPAASVARTR